MKLRNKKTGEICELGHIRQAWREEKDGGMGYMLLKANDNNGIIYNSLAEMMDEWEDYKPVEPLIKDEKIRKAVRAWAEAQGLTEVYLASNGYEIYGGVDDWVMQFEGEPFPFADKNRLYTISELCGEDEE